jgi:hypothetical protein
MRHPSESDLALYAGNDLGRLARLRLDWHLRSCGKCQQEVTEFSSLRADMVRTAPEPQVNWDRLAAEMKANIRLGLEAGECINIVQPAPRGHSPWAWAALMTAALIAVAAGGEFWINHPWSADPAKVRLAAGAAAGVAARDIVLEVKGGGIQIRDGSAVMSELSNRNGGEAVYSVNAQGGVGASYVDRETGMATVDNISYGQ